MARTAFEQVIELQLQRYGPEAARRKHIEIARRGLAGFMAGQQSKPVVTIETDGHRATSEESVRPFGIIVYRFSRLREIARYAHDEAVRLSPTRSGRYRRSWFVIVDGAEVALDSVPQNATQVILVNDQPYARKIHVGARGFERYVPPGIVEKVRQLVLKRYRTIASANLEFIELAGGYKLKGRGRHKAAGKPLSYPALVLKPRV